MLENHWAREYLKGILDVCGISIEDLRGIVASLDAVDDPLLEIAFLRQGGSATKCLNLSIAVLAQCKENTPLLIVAELVEAVENSNGKLLAFRAELPKLKKDAAEDPQNGEKLAKLAFALSALDEWEPALTAYTKALEYPDTLCGQCHRDCLVNVGWDHYLKGEYEEALGWFEMACSLKESQIEDTRHVRTSQTERAEAPYKLALENVLLTLAKMGRLTEATARLQEYHDWFGRLPAYETRALEKLGLQPDVIFIRSRIRNVAD
jgi:tetratricopeptide (TPR) repeat protein